MNWGVYICREFLWLYDDFVNSAGVYVVLNFIDVICLILDFYFLSFTFFIVFLLFLEYLQPLTKLHIILHSTRHDAIGHVISRLIYT